MNEPKNQPCEVPLVEQLESVPGDLYDARLCHEAAKRIRELEQDATEWREAPQRCRWIPLDPAQGGRKPTAEDADENGVVVFTTDKGTRWVDDFETMINRPLLKAIAWHPLAKFVPEPDPPATTASVAST